MNVLLAPNGKPSNLTPEQYKLVRLPAFKEWFGDWEKGIFTDYQKFVEYKHKIGTGGMNILYIDSICENIDLDKAKKIKEFHKKAFEFLYSEYENANKNGYIIDFQKFITQFLMMCKPVFDLVNQLTSNPNIESTKETLKDFQEKDFQEWINYKNKNISKVVDSNGEPLVVYHGTKVNWWNEHFVFNPQYEGKSTSVKRRKFGSTYFTSKKKVAQTFGNILIPVFLNFKNPIVIDAEYHDIMWVDDELETTNYEDDIIIKNTYDYRASNVELDADMSSDIFLVTQIFNKIKLADGTNTTFDGNNPDIRYAGGGEVFYHGSTDKNLAGKKGIHIGTKLASTEALESRIGVPSKGEWDGKREYGKTLLAGKKRLKELEKERGYYLVTGYNTGRDIPEEDYYPTQRKERAVYSDGTPIPFDSKPIVFPVKIKGRMTNSKYNPHTDDKANSMMLRNLKMGNAKSGYYYTNIAEDEGSISAVVPDNSFIEIIDNNPDIRFKDGGDVNIVDIKQYNIENINYRFVEIAEKNFNKIELYRQEDDGKYYGVLLYRKVPRYIPKFSSPMVRDINQLYAFESVSNQELFNAVKNKEKPFADLGFWVNYYEEGQIENEINKYIYECDKYNLDYSVKNVNYGSEVEIVHFQCCQKGTFDELFNMDDLIEDYSNNNSDGTMTYFIEDLEALRDVELSYFLDNEWDGGLSDTGLILGIPPKFTMGYINMGKTYGLAKEYKYKENVTMIENKNNPYIKYDDGGMVQKNKNRILSSLSNYESYDKWKSENKSDYTYSQKNYILREIKEYYGLEHKVKAKYTFADVLEDAKKYDSYSDWASKSRAKYDYSRINGWLVEIKKQFNYSPKAVKYTLESIVEKVKQYDSFQEWRENNSSEYQTAKIKGWLPEIKNSIGYDKTNIQQIDKVKLTLDVIIDSTKYYDSYSEWRLKNDSKYKKAIEQGWLEQIKELFNYEKRGRKDTLESIIEKVKQYPSYTEWVKDDVLTYQLALKRGYLNEIKNAIGYEESKYTLESVIKTAKEFGSFQQWRENNLNQYYASQRNGWLNEIKDAIGYKTKKSQKKTQLDLIIQNAKEYKSYVEWIENNPNEFLKSHEKGWLSKIKVLFNTDEFEDGGDVWDVDRYRQVEKEMYDLQQQDKTDSAEYFKLIKERSILERNKMESKNNSEENMNNYSTEKFAKGGKILVKQITENGETMFVHNDSDKFRRIGITDKYFIEASNDVGLQGVVFNSQALEKKIEASFNKLLETYNSYLISKDSDGITFYFENEIRRLQLEGYSLERIETERAKINNPAERQKVLEQTAKIQKEAVEQWVIYLRQSEYPIPFKYLMLKAVLTSNYDMKLDRLFQRTNETTRNITPFDAGILAELFYSNSNYLVYDYVVLMNENSRKILNSKEIIDQTSKGKWIKFNGDTSKTTPQEIESNGNQLMKLVQNTFWCTKSAGKSQLERGDFYVYVTEENGEVLPQIAVRMSGNEVGEVRGNVSSAQDLSAEMLPIAKRFLLTNIPNDSGKRWLNNIQYNQRCVALADRFEKEGLFEGFILEYMYLVANENKYKVEYGKNGNVERMLQLFEKAKNESPSEFYKKDDIETNYQLLSPRTKYFIGDIGNTELNYLTNQNINVSDFTNWDLKYVSGDFDCSNIVTNLGKIEYVGGSLTLSENTTNFDSVNYVGYEFKMSSAQITTLGNIETLGSDLVVNSSLTDLGKLKMVGGSLTIISCDEKFSLGNLEEIQGDLIIKVPDVNFDFGKLKVVEGNFDATKTILTDLKYLESVGKDFSIAGSKIKQFTYLKTIGGNANFSNNFSTSTQNIETILGDVKLLNSRIVEFPRLEIIGGTIELRGSYIKSFGNIKSIGGNMKFDEGMVEDLGDLQVINGYASFQGSKIKSLNKLQKIVKFAVFNKSMVEDLGDLKTIGGNAHFEDTIIKSIGELRFIGGVATFLNNDSLKFQWEKIKDAE